MPKLAQDVPAEVGHGLVLAPPLEVLPHPPRRVLLQVLVIGHDLHHAVPDGVAHKLPREADQPHHRVHVPPQVGRELLREDGDLEGDLLPDSEVGVAQVPQQLVHDPARVLPVAHAVEQLQRAAADGDIGVVEGGDDLRLVTPDRLHHLGDHAHAAHVLEAEVADVGLPYGDELPQQRHALAHELVLPVQVHHEPQRLEQHGVRGVVLVDDLHHLSAHQHALQHAEQRALHRAVLGRRVVLQHAHDLHLEPRGGQAVVGVLGGHVLVGDEPVEDLHHLGNAVLVSDGVGGDERDEQGDDACEDPDVPLVQQLQHLVRPRLRH
mmetsp:Transcript_6732/g.23492  ORF Transcript_6732/g.23492 Transcript_6732/m.23492 type:complete len:322 (-) Transcript_6732:362-1327(-)